MMNKDLKIKTIELFKVQPRWLFLKMTTEGGLVGWGEPVIEGRADTVAAAVQELMPYVIGRSAGDIEDVWQVLYRGGFYRGGPVLTSAVSGIEQILRGNTLVCRSMSCWAAPAKNGCVSTAGLEATVRTKWAKRRWKRRSRATPRLK